MTGVYHALCQDFGVDEKKKRMLSVNGMRPPEKVILSPPKISRSVKETCLALSQLYLPNDTG